MKHHYFRYAFDHDASWYALPQLLNFYGVTVEQVKAMKIRDKPGLLRHIMVAAKPELKPAIRNYFKRHPKADAGGLFQWITRGRDLAEAQNRLKYFVLNAIEAGKVEDGADGKVTSQIKAAFGYDPDDDCNPDGFWKVLECPKCGHESESFSDSEDLTDTIGFEHISGPYQRCGGCDAVVKPELIDADHAPYHDEDSWEYYTDHLQEILDQMQALLPMKAETLHLTIRNSDWRGRDALADIPCDGEKLAETMRVNGQFCIRNGQMIQTQAGVYLKCTLYHHDAPTGSPIMIYPTSPCELDDDEIVYITSEKPYLGPAASVLFAGRHFCFEINEGYEVEAVSKQGFMNALEGLLRTLRVPEEEPLYVFADCINLDNVQTITAYATALRELIDRYIEENE